MILELIKKILKDEYGTSAFASSKKILQKDCN